MTEMNHAKSFRDLLIYQKAIMVSRRIFEISKAFPKEETYSLTDQIWRSSRFIGAQIAEAWGKRRYEKHFVCKLTDADAEQLETQHWLDEAFAFHYIGKEQADELKDKLMRIGRMLNSMIGKSSLFCGQGDFTVRDEISEYDT